MRKLDGKAIKAGKFDLEIIVFDRFGLPPIPGGLYDQDPAFVDELNVFLNADAEYQRKKQREHERK